MTAAASAKLSPGIIPARRHSERARALRSVAGLLFGPSVKPASTITLVIEFKTVSQIFGFLKKLF